MGCLTGLREDESHFGHCRIKAWILHNQCLNIKFSVFSIYEHCANKNLLSKLGLCFEAKLIDQIIVLCVTDHYSVSSLLQAPSQSFIVYLTPTCSC